MIKNYFKIAWRNLLKHKGLSFINILGLSIGLACFSLFLLYTVHEFSFDRFHTNADNVFRVYRWIEPMRGEEADGDAYLPAPLGPALKEEFPDCEEVVRWKESWGESFVRIEGVASRAHIDFAESNLLDVFSFPIIYGDMETPLDDPKKVIMTEETALRLFGESNPTGKTIEIKVEDDFESFLVSAILEDVPSNSSRQFEIIGNFDFYLATALGARRANNWNSSFLNVYVKLRDGSGLATNYKALQSFRKKYYPNEEDELRAEGTWTGEGPPVTYKLQPLLEVHTNDKLSGGDIPSVNPKNIWMLLTIAAGVLFIAIINFTTLAIGRSAARAREVGIRKVVGSNRIQLANQFLSESILLSVISAIMGLGLAQLLLPAFNHLSGRELVFSLSTFPEISLLVVISTVLTGVLAGSYPALMLSGFKPVEVFKNNIKLGGSNWFTRSLVTSQFVLSSGLVIATLVIINQLDFLKSKHPGFQKENVLVVDANDTDTKVIYPRFKERLINNPRVIGVAGSELGLGAGTGWSRSGFDYQGERKTMFEYFVDDDYLNVMGMKLIAGRGFEPDRQDGANKSIIVNEALVKDYNWSVEEALGQVLSGYAREGENDPVIVGVVQDFHFRSFKEQVKPQMFHQFEDYDPYKFFVRIGAGNPSEVLSDIEAAWTAVAPGLPFKHTFLDEDIDRFYRAEERFSSIISWAGGISIFLACLGLLGLAALAAVNRRKEVGIRRVLGASVTGIVRLLSKDFIKLVLIALSIASPIVWYLMNGWLENFAYSIDITWWMFSVAGITAVLIAFLTVGSQAVRAALTNPVDSLRGE